MIAEGGQHFMGAEGRVGTRSACGVTNTNRFVLREGGRRPGDVVMFVLTRMWSEVKDSPPEEGMDNRLLQRSDDVGVDGSIHESILDGVEAVSEDIVVPCDAHVPCHRRRCLVCVSGQRREEMG